MEGPRDRQKKTWIRFAPAKQEQGTYTEAGERRKKNIVQRMLRLWDRRRATLGQTKGDFGTGESRRQGAVRIYWLYKFDMRVTELAGIRAANFRNSPSKMCWCYSLLYWNERRGEERGFLGDARGVNCDMYLWDEWRSQFQGRFFFTKKKLFLTNKYSWKFYLEISVKAF